VEKCFELAAQTAWAYGMTIADVERERSPKLRQLKHVQTQRQTTNWSKINARVRDGT